MSVEMNSSVLLIEDDDVLRSTLKTGLEGRHYTVEEADCGKSGISKFESDPEIVVLCDLKLPDVDGLEVVNAVKQKDEDAIVIVVTGFATVDSSVKALEQGAFDFLAKPVNFKHLDIVIRRALMQRHVRLAASEFFQKDNLGLVGSSPQMNRVRTRIRGLAKHDLTVMIQGETGTGKELAAHAIHNLGSHRKDPFIALNCGALPESLLESELFGYVKGAFTGALADKHGLFESAAGGTVFLDEIDSASPHTQAALLRVLDHKEVRPVGGRTVRPVDVRIIVASNKDLESLVHRDMFRKDLFFRVISSTVMLPPLRDRIEDIPELVDHFTKECEQSSSGPSKRFSPRALELLMQYPWPGNVRELKHIVQSVVLSSTKPVLRPADLLDAMRVPAMDKSFMSLAEAERQHVEMALRLANENKSEAARLLHIGRSSLYSLLYKHGL